ncbi:DNA recombination protein RmuC [Actinomycetes bacterium M1A6_2h]
MSTVTAVGLIVALVLGVVLGWLLHSSRGSQELARTRERLAVSAENEDTLHRSLSLLNEDSARRHSRVIGQQVSHLVEPLREAVDTLSEQVDHVERTRIHAYAGLSEQVADMHRASQHLSSQTSELVTALRAPQVRGRWGEIQLERVVELSGMTRHCDFDTQVARGGVRPDLVVRLAGGKHIVVDAKVPLTAFLDAAAATDTDVASRHLMRHARHLRTHVDQLADKEYWLSFDPSPEFVILFVPGDSFLDAALTHDSGLLEHAFGRSVILATPTTLIALLRTVAYTWKQDALAKDAATIHALGRELYERLGSASAHVDKLGAQLGKAVDSFNSAAGSLDSRVFVTARKLHELDVFDGEIPGVTRIDAWPRTAPRNTETAPPGHANGAT